MQSKINSNQLFSEFEKLTDKKNKTANDLLLIVSFIEQKLLNNTDILPFCKRLSKKIQNYENKIKSLHDNNVIIIIM